MLWKDDPECSGGPYQPEVADNIDIPDLPGLTLEEEVNRLVNIFMEIVKAFYKMTSDHAIRR